MAKLIIFSAPSGSGKSTIINYLLTQNLNLAFSISATSRPPRGTEKDGVEYFFLTPDEFRRRIANDEFLEYEEVYQDRFYGTLKEQVEKQLAMRRRNSSGVRKKYSTPSFSVPRGGRLVAEMENAKFRF
jgi:guanylate kinase